MLTVFIRVVVLYAFSVLAMRLMGKRQVGQLQPYELVLALMVAEIAAAPMENMGTPLLYGLVPILGLLVLHGICTALAFKSMRVRRLLFGIPGVVIRDGRMDIAQMQRMGYTVTDLMEELRGQGYADISQIQTAILETNGRLSAFPKTIHAPLTAEDMHMEKKETGMPHLLIMDGRVQEKHLQESGHNEAWLEGQLKKMGVRKMRDVLLASLNGENMLYVQQKKSEMPHIMPTGGDA